MTDTVELRWFLRGTVPSEARAWFDGLFRVVCVEARTDRYLVPTTDGCGLKLREGRAEMKTRLGVAAPLQCGAAVGTPAEWRKQILPALPERASVDVAKRRRLGRHESSNGICTLELSDVEVYGERWWSVCLEATGPGSEPRESALREGARQWFLRPDTPAFPQSAARAYPEWLREVTS